MTAPEAVVGMLATALAALAAAAEGHVHNLRVAADCSSGRRRREFLAKANRWQSLADSGRDAIAAAARAYPDRSNPDGAA